MRIVVASAFSAGSQFAHAINTLKMADGFAKLGHDVTVICRRPGKKPFPTDVLRENFRLAEILDIVQVPNKFFGRRLDEHNHFGFQAAVHALRLRAEVAYCRSYLAPVWLSRFGLRVAAESHAHPGNAMPPLLQMVRATASRNFCRVVTIAPILKENFVNLGVPEQKVLVLPDAVDITMFQRPQGRAVRNPEGRPQILYAGHLYDYKGIPTILEAAALLPDCDFVLVGGTKDDIARQKARVAELGLSNVTLTGLLPMRDVPERLWKADVLLLPPSAQHPSAKWTSPVKLGEYLASGTPVVATRIPALAYWLSDQEVCFMDPDDPGSMADAIRRVLGSREYARSLACHGFRLAEKMSYQVRCRKILARLQESE